MSDDNELPLAELGPQERPLPFVGMGEQARIIDLSEQE